MTTEHGLDAEDLRVTRALGGTVSALDLLRAHVQETGGETRPQQERMVQAVTDAIATGTPLLAQAGTGTGKSLAYLFPVAASGRRAVIATATNQLSEQLVRHDLPRVKATLADVGLDVTFALLKGRNNYYCLERGAELERLDAQAPGTQQDRLFDDEPAEVSTSRRSQARADAHLVADLIEWGNSTPTGDRSEAPPVPDRVWAQVSTGTADCPGAGDCPFGSLCFTEKARARARAAQIVVTNHALLAQEIRAAGTLREGTSDGGGGMFGQHDIVIADEAHDLPDSLTSALSSEVDPRTVSKFLTKANRHIDDEQTTPAGDSLTVEKARTDLEHLTDAMESLPQGALEALDPTVADYLAALVTRILMLQTMLTKGAAKAAGDGQSKRAAALGVLAAQAGSLAEALSAARTVAPGYVRWSEQRRAEDPPVLRTAPLEVGYALTAAVDDKTFIATSATLTVAGNFTPVQRVLGLDPAACTTVDVGSPFNYPMQGMLYVPKAPFPEPVGRERTAHTEAVLDDLVALVSSAGGRTLALFTTTAGALRAADHLRTHLPHLTVHAHGDAPADVLVRQFAEEETSVLCATMGLWQGVDVRGESLSLVIVDKIAFAPVDDVLTAARRALADSRGRDGFNEVVVAQAATSLAQAAGRLIRHTGDKGVVAILDPRLHTKGYGRILLGSLPPFRVFTDRDVVTAALERLTGGTTRTATSRPQARATSATKTPGRGGPGSRNVGKDDDGKPAARKRTVPKRASATRQLAKQPRPRPKKID